MFRDPTELRRLYKIWKEKTVQYEEAIEKIISGSDAATVKMADILHDLQIAHEAFTAESKHFVRWK